MVNEKTRDLVESPSSAIENLLIEELQPMKLETKRQKLLECVLTGNSKIFLGKTYTEDQINKLNPAELDKLFGAYEARLSGRMAASLGKSLINMYSLGACAWLGISDKKSLSDDLESDPFLSSALQRFTCELYYRFGSFLFPLSVGLITSKHYLHNKNDNQREEQRNTNNCREPNQPTNQRAE